MTKSKLPSEEASKDTTPTGNEDVSKDQHASKVAKRQRHPTLNRLKRLADKYGSILTIAAIIVASYELIVVHRSANKIENLLRTAENQASVLKQSAEEIQNLSRAAATRYISTFPNNMSEMTKMISGTEENLVVACDFAAYGHFSSPQEFLQYLSALQALVADGKKVTLICYSESRAEKARDEQFGDWTRIQSMQSFKDNYKNSPPKSRQEFFDDLRAFEVRTMCSMVQKGINVLETGKDKAGKDKDLPIFFWISDGSRAMFSFYAYGNDPREMSFQTRDASFIRPLLQVQEQIESESRPFDQSICSKYR